MLTMYDDIYPQNLPAGGDAYLGYVGGSWPTFTGWTDSNGKVYPPLSQWPVTQGKHLLSLAVEASYEAEGLDVETYDATIAQSGPWTQSALGRGVWRPVLYVGQSNLGALLAELSNVNIARSSVRLLTAHYDNGWNHLCGPGTCGAPADVDGTQWQSLSNYDISALLNNFFDPAPAASSQPTVTASPAVISSPTAPAVTTSNATASPSEEDPMTVIASTQAGQPTFAVVGGTVFPLGDGHDLQQLTADGAKVVHLDPASFTAFRKRAGV